MDEEIKVTRLHLRLGMNLINIQEHTWETKMFLSCRIAIYTRVSTEDQAREGYSLDVQREYLLNFVKQQGHGVFL
jgi:hypothetical protein